MSVTKVLYALTIGAGVTLIIGLIYLTITVPSNPFKQDSIAAWLSKCCWTQSVTYRSPDTEAGRETEISKIRKVIPSSRITVRRTFDTDFVQIGKTFMPVENNNGAWLKIRIPHELQGWFIQFDIATSRRKGFLGTRKIISESIRQDFIDNGRFQRLEQSSSLPTHKPNPNHEPAFSEFTHEHEDRVWLTWVPVGKDDDFLEIQIWYPADMLKTSSQDAGYLYQFDLNAFGQTSNDGLNKTELAISNKSRENAMELYVRPPTER